MDNKFKFMFIRGEHNFPIGCIAMCKFSDRIEYQVSTLNPRDRFDRRLARQLALGRLVENPIKLPNATQKLDEAYRFIMTDIKNNEDMPKRARSAAKNWLTHEKK